MDSYIGIDVSKATFDADIRGKVRQFRNDAKGAQALLKSTVADSIYVIESTGTYSVGLSEALVRAGRRVKLVNPLAVKRFGQSQLKRAKTDAVDAKLLTMFGPNVKDPDFELVNEGTNAARQHQTVIEQLVKQQTALKNQLEAIIQLPRPAAEVVDALRATIKQIDQAIKQLRKSMRTHCEAAYPGMLERLESVKGIGEKIAPAIIATADGFTHFTSAKQVIAYMGACPTIRDSGTSIRGDGRISRLNNPLIRTKCYMGAMAAIRYDNEFKDTYMRHRRNGKPKKVALMCVINKMLRVSFAVAKQGTMYDPKYLANQAQRA